MREGDGVAVNVGVAELVTEAVAEGEDDRVAVVEEVVVAVGFGDVDG